MKLWETRPMPARERAWLTRITATVWAGVLAWNVSHVFEHLGQHGVHGWRQLALAFAPDVLILIGVWKLRYLPTAVIGWLMSAAGLAWLSWAALSTCEASASGRLIAVAPIGTVVLMTLALEFDAGRPAPDATPTAKGQAPAPARPARRRPAKRPAPAPEPTVATLLPPDAPLTDELPTVPETPKDPLPIRPPRPSREGAREILANIGGNLDRTSNGWLSRTHGGSDVWWGQQRKAYLEGLALANELDALGTGLPVE